MSGSMVLVERRDAVTILTINNPRQRNAMSGPVKAELIPAMRAALADAGCRAIVLTGAEGCFSAGGDVSRFSTMAPEKGRQLVRDQREFLHLVMRGDKAVIAAVEGYSYGAGFGLAMACDHIVAARDARFCAAFNKIGLMPDGGLLWTLPQRIGAERAREMMMLATVVDGAEGHRIGLVDTLAEPKGALDAALAKAALFAAAAPIAVAMTKSAFARWPLNLDQFLAMEADGQALLLSSEDCREGARAFLEKRAPAFRGR